MYYNEIVAFSYLLLVLFIFQIVYIISIYTRKKKRENLRRKERLEKKRQERERLKKEREKERQRKEREEKERKEIDKLNKEIKNKYNEIKEDLPIPFFIDSIRLMKLKNSGNDSCPICLGNFKRGNWCLYLSCLHLFHLVCIIRWLLNHDNCPQCKAKYKNEEINNELFRYNNNINNILHINQNSAYVTYFQNHNTINNDNNNINSIYNNRNSYDYINERGS